jgi:hypothetical protein
MSKGRAPIRRSSCLLGLLAALGCLFLAGNLYSNPGIITQQADLLLDGAPISSVAVGQTVTILGKNDQTGEILISVPQADGSSKVGLVPESAVLDKSQPVPAPAPGASRSSAGPDNTLPPDPAPSGDPFTDNRVWTAAELSEFMKDNRDRFAEFQGKKIKLTGVVSGASVTGRGDTLKMSFSLQTPPTMPRISVSMSPAYLLGSSFIERFRFERHSSQYTPTTNFRRIREGVAAQVVWEYTSSYSSSTRQRGYQWNYRQESPWVPIVSNNSSTTVLATLSDGRFEIALTDGEFVD